MNKSVAGAGVLRRGNTFLAGQRPEGKIMAGYWEFPGGKIEPGETPEAALCRELNEELGITAVAPTFWRTMRHRYDHGLITLHVFFVSAFEGEPASMENQEIRWVTADTALTLTFLPADVPLVRDLSAME